MDFLWSSLADGTVIGDDEIFDPDSDRLVFDNPAIFAAGVSLQLATGVSSTFTFGGKSITLMLAPEALTSANIAFASGSVLLVGDNTTGLTQDGASNSLRGSSLHDFLSGLGGNDKLLGGPGNDMLDGGTGADLIAGSGGHDTLDGGAGADTLAGGPGNDTYFVSEVPRPTYLVLNDWFASDTDYFFTAVTGDFPTYATDYALDADSLVDTVRFYYSEPNGGHFFSAEISTRMLGVPLEPGFYDDAMRFPFEAAGHPGLTVSGDGFGANTSAGEFTVVEAEFDYTGTSPTVTSLLVDYVYLPGGFTAFGRMSIGSPGAGDVVWERADEGSDTVWSPVTYLLPFGVENLQLTGAAAVDGLGNSLDNRLAGNGASNALFGDAGNDTLDGGAGTDLMAGGAGNDAYFVSEVPRISVSLENWYEDVTSATGTVTIYTYGIITGSDAERVDTVRVYYTDPAGSYLDLTISTARMGIPLAPGTYGDVMGHPFEDDGHPGMSLSSDGAAVTVDGGEFTIFESEFTHPLQVTTLLVDFTIPGGGFGGVPITGTLSIEESHGDSVFERPDEGTDTVYSLLSYLLPLNVENLVLTGSDSTSGTGNYHDNVLTGSTANNLLVGYGGSDLLTGGTGDDSLDGGDGTDTLDGGVGDDFLTIDLADFFVDAGGIDTIVTAYTYTLPDGFENLALSGTEDVDGTGNAVANVLTGNDGDFGFGMPFGIGGHNVLSGLAGDDLLMGMAGFDTLDGGAGRDTLVGGRGNDTFIGTITATAGPGGIEFLSDVYVEAVGEGNDTVYSGSSVTLPDDSEIETLVLNGAPMWRAYVGMGSALDNHIIGEGLARHRLFGAGGSDTLDGGDGVDTLDGGGGIDALYGGSGDDVLIYDAADVTVHGGNGTDTLLVSGAGITLDLTAVPDTLVQDIEVIGLTGSGNNTLTLTLPDALAISSSTETLRIDGDAGDRIDGGRGWTQGADIVIGGQTYAVYTQEGATLQVDVDVDRGGILVSEIDVTALDGSGGFRLVGVAPGDLAGTSVSAVGDFDGDGYEEILVGAPAADPNGLSSGAAYLVFGAIAGIDASLELSALNGSNGFRILGEAETDRLGTSVSPAGDVNGDGFADLLVGAPGELASYVVFGGSGSQDADLDMSLLTGTNGFRISGEITGDVSPQAGRSVASAGDINGDGYDDLLIGAYESTGYYLGASYVLFGANSFPGNVNLGDVYGTTSFKIVAETTADSSGFSVSSAGDVNGDGLDDLLIGARFADSNGSASGKSYVVFGKGSEFGATFQLSELDGANGFSISGAASFENSGWSVSAAGDVNGDGLGDIIVGAIGASRHGTGAGASYVVFGGAFGASLDLSTLTEAEGFAIAGEAAGDSSGYSVSSAGDVNGDGYDDLLIGAPGADPGGEHSGAGYVVFGRSGGFGAVSDLSALSGADGFRISGGLAGDYAGVFVASAGDVNGDGFSDVLVGAPRADPNGSDSGASYVVFGRDFTGAVDYLGGADGEALAGGAGGEAFIAGQGGDTIAGGGGADVIRGGEGDDWILVPDALFFDVDGGTGQDTLRIENDLVTFDLATLAGSRISGIEVIDLGGGAGNRLGVNALEVLNLSDTSNVLRVDGSAVDAVDAGVGWTQGENIVIGPDTYAQYTSGAATLQVDMDVDRSGIGTEAMSLAALDGTNGFRLVGIDAGDYSGHSVASAGDVNGDGFDDVIVGAYRENGYAGKAYIVFGKSGVFSASLALATLDDVDGFRLEGIGGSTGYAVASAGDVNSDGYDDVIIGAFGTNNGTGESYVVFGTGLGFGVSVSLATLDGSNGFRLDGIDQNDISGFSVASAGDVNGDGCDDLIIGANGANRGTGESYVVFGTGSGFAPSLALSALNGANGFRLDGIDLDDVSGASVASAGDVNGDGYDDVIVGAYRANGVAGESYVVFGKGSDFSASLALATLDGANGFRLNGIDSGDRSGISVASAGDVNGDGYDDLIVGADHANYWAGESYVVFGKGFAFTASLALSTLNGSNGFRLDGIGIDFPDSSGYSVASAGDVNGDGYDDLIVGAKFANDYAGESYVVFGTGSGFGANLALSSLDGTNGFRIVGEAADDHSGRSVSAAGDVNGDGFDDLVIGARFADPNGIYSGASYVVFGGDFSGAVDFLGTMNIDALSGTGAADVFVAGQGNDMLIGGGGADVFRGGEGDDRMVVSDTGFFDVDGGRGSDTLALDGGGITLDLMLIADSKLAGMEAIDLTGSGDNTLALNVLEVLNLSDSTNTLRIDGNAGDVVNAGSGWGAPTGPVTIGAQQYNSYTQGLATLLVDTDVIQNVV